jgi:hypothetical protein
MSEGPYGEFTDCMRAMLSDPWPRCQRCEAELMLGRAGALCPDCPGPILSLSAIKIWNTPQVSIGALREMFPEKCVN